MRQLFAVIGNPVLHSHSPQLWNHAFRQLDIDAQYFRINPTDASKAMRAFREIGLTGCNVTTPFKEEVIPHLDELDEAAEALHAVNTIRCEDGALQGFNTDYYGVVQALRDQGIDPQGKKALVLGAGGAARAAVYGLQEAQARDVVVLNRTISKAQRIAQKFDCRAAPLAEVPHELLDADILISCIPFSEAVFDMQQLPPHLAVCDANYASSSELLRAAQDQGCTTVSALSWLVHQAIAAFQLFFDVDPTAAMKAAIQQAPSQRKKSVGLIGFMGAGKSAVGKPLARMAKSTFIDTDEAIEELAGQRIPEIFTQHGETQFRELEQAVFERLDMNSRQVISCGGGAIKNPAIRQRLHAHATIVWLWSSLHTSLERIARGSRPLLAADNPEERARQILTERIPIYANSADLLMINEDISPKALAAALHQELFARKK